jgi:hypothetical protein
MWKENVWASKGSLFYLVLKRVTVTRQPGGRSFPCGKPAVLRTVTEGTSCIRT